MKKIEKLLLSVENVNVDDLKKIKSIVKSRENKKALESLRTLGYETCESVGELIDNSIDAKAKEINIHIMKIDGNISFILSDNGCGMNSDRLQTAAEWGSNYTKPKDNLGKFGMGLSTSSLSMGRKRKIISKTARGKNIHCEIIDLDKINEGDVWNPTVYVGVDAHKNLYDGLNLNGSGTIVIVSNTDRINYRGVDEFENDLLDYIGMTYFKILSNVKIYVNNKIVKAIDPILWKDKKINQINEGTIEIPHEGKTYILTYKAVLFPYGGLIEKGVSIKSTKYNKIHKLSIDNMGVYVYREDRLFVAAIAKLGNYSLISQNDKHSIFNRFRVDLSFGSECDKLLGVTFTKNNISNANIDAIEKIREVLASVQQMASNILKKEKDDRKVDTTDYDEDALVISKRLKGKLDKIDDKHKEDSPEKPKNDDTLPKDDKPKEDSPEKSKKTRINKLVEFRVEKASPNDPIYRSEQPSSNKVIVYYNCSHIFYSEVIEKLSGEAKRIFNLTTYGRARGEWVLIGRDIKNIDRLEKYRLEYSNVLKEYYS